MAAVFILLSVFYVASGQNNLTYSVRCEDSYVVEPDTTVSFDTTAGFRIDTFPVLQDRNDPTTAAPSLPTTAEPTTTDEPTTAAPTTAEPTEPTADPTAEPTNAEITTANPTTAEPTTAPTTSQPTMNPTSALPTVTPDRLCYLRLDIPAYDSDANTDTVDTEGMFVPGTNCTFKVSIRSPDATLEPTAEPVPTSSPTLSPTLSPEALTESVPPTKDPTQQPSVEPTNHPTGSPTATISPTYGPTVEPTNDPTSTRSPTMSPTGVSWNPQLDELELYSLLMTEGTQMAWRHGYNVDGAVNYTLSVVPNCAAADNVTDTTDIDPDTASLEELEALFDASEVIQIALGQNVQNNTELFPMTYTVRNSLTLDNGSVLPAKLTADIAGDVASETEILCATEDDGENSAMTYYLYAVAGEAVQSIDNVVMSVSVELVCVAEEEEKDDEEDTLLTTTVIIVMCSVAALICIVSIGVAIYLWRRDNMEKEDEYSIKENRMNNKTKSQVELAELPEIDAAEQKTNDEMTATVEEFKITDKKRKEMVANMRQNSLSVGLEYWEDDVGLDRKVEKEEKKETKTGVLAEIAEYVK